MSVLKSKDLVFVDIDTQKDFMDQDGALYVPGAESIIENLKMLVDFARKGSIPVVSSMDTHIPDDPEFEEFPPHCLVNTPGWQKIEGTGPSEREEWIIILKHEIDIFSNSAFERTLKELGRKNAVAFGVATEYCVRSAVLGILERGFTTFVVQDAIKGITEDGERRAIEEMKKRGAQFISTADLIQSVEI